MFFQRIVVDLILKIYIFLILVISNIDCYKLERYNSELKYFNHLGAELAWKLSTQLENSNELLSKNEELLLTKNMWNNEWCLKLLDENLTNIFDMRQLYLICRGPRFSSYQLNNVLKLLSQLRSTYDITKICISNGHCYRMEPDLNNFMETVRNEQMLREAWNKWHRAIGQDLTGTYVQLVKLMNTGARQAGHRDIGTCWREEMETINLYSNAIKLYSEVKYLYTLLHTFVRYKIERFYGLDIKGKTIPAHLLGNMWSQRWDSLMNIVWSSTIYDQENSDEYIREHIGKNATVEDMVHYAENFYVNMGFPHLPDSFHQNSYFQSNSTNKNCHGSAANMYGNGDYRIMICASVKDSDLQTIIHEMGHIHYFIAYKDLPTIFQDGANSAFHEAVGDSVTYGMYPQPSIKTLMKIGLAKLPQISFGLIVDLWRWKIFENENSVHYWNDYWWELHYEYLGVSKPNDFNSSGLDALGKYHIVDNIPYIRYYFASFLQHMFYESMCGHRHDGDDDQFCNLKGRGDGLRKMMSRGTSTHWSQILEEFTGSDTVTSSALLKYFKPLQIYLENQVAKLNLHLGW